MSTSEDTHAPPMPTARDALYSFVEHQLLAATGQTIAQFILERRTPENEVPYRRIASEIVEITRIDITHEAARRWHHRAAEAAAGAEEDRVTRIIQEAQARQAEVQSASVPAA